MSQAQVTDQGQDANQVQTPLDELDANASQQALTQLVGLINTGTMTAIAAIIQNCMLTAKNKSKGKGNLYIGYLYGCLDDSLPSELKKVIEASVVKPFFGEKETFESVSRKYMEEED